MIHSHDMPAGFETGPTNEQFIAGLVKERDDANIPQSYMDVGTLLLNEVARRNDPNGINPKKYHNVQHHRDVMGFGFDVLDFMKHELKLDVQDLDYGVLIITAAAHDLFNDTFSNGIAQTGEFELRFGDITIIVTNDGTKTDESLSAEAAVLLLNKLGFPSAVQRRVGPAIMMTEMTTDNGVQRQKNAGKGVDFAAVALAVGDTLGIALHSAKDVEMGIEKAKSDIPRLTAELLKGEVADTEKITKTIDNFSQGQGSFINQSITDAAKNLFALVDDPYRRKLVQDRMDRIRENARSVIKIFETEQTKTRQDLLDRYYQLLSPTNTHSRKDKQQ